MGVYAITGGTKGIGLKTAEKLRELGHDVFVIASRNADINGDLATAEGRNKVVSELYRLCPEGIDGLVCNHGISPDPINSASKILSVNYYGAVAVMEQSYELLKKKKGSCVVTVSAAIVSKPRGKYFVDDLLLRCADESRVGRLADSLPLEDGFVMYASAKLALCRWVAQHAPSWASEGVMLNAVAPGGVATDIMKDFDPPEDAYFPMPALQGGAGAMDPKDVAAALVYMVLPDSKGICGHVLFCDSGSACVFDSPVL